jgi:hypothetical protein
MDNNDLIAQYLPHLEDPLEDVLKQLGQTVYVPLGARPPSPARLVAAAREWISEEHGSICQALWNDPRTADFMRGGRTYQLPELFGVVLDILQTLSHEPTTCGWAAIYLVRLGLNLLCPEQSEPVAPANLIEMEAQTGRAATSAGKETPGIPAPAPQVLTNRHGNGE